MSDWYYLRDGGQFGPMPWAELWRHGQTGQLRPTDLVWKEGMPEWRTAASVPTLFPESPPAPQPAPAVQPAPAPQPQAAPYRPPAPAPQPQAPAYAQSAPQPSYAARPGPQPVPPQSAGDAELMRWVLPVGRSPWAIAAGYLGLLSFLVVFAPFALITGIIAVIDIKKNPRKHGMGRAIFGIVMGLLGCIILGFILVAVATEQSAAVR